MIRKVLILSGLSVLAACGGGGGGSGSALGSGGGGGSSSAQSVGKFIYVANTGEHSVTGYAINATTGALSPILGTPFDTGAANIALGVAAHPSGNFLYATNFGSTTVQASISAFTVNASTGSLSLISGLPYLMGRWYRRHPALIFQCCNQMEISSM